ncbi:hypothetical protein BDB00DRAFT_839212 [Zychaea mexicana]|uniref:uncharacterized protein n=1 Tax=Zychaea mexicana TaxID=64656 RepID=UPI0022FE1307|nr:uncharacterized protein BDB00DRAFT_839212 [Zychaea mexicana]KAI9490146.1 hypothetical protein BDB00DRAFT_839212 [Zychaea mexicana]
MPTIIPYLMGGKVLQGVLSPHEQPSRHSDPLVDIESCIDDPSLAPLGHHVRNINVNSGSNDSTADNSSRRKSESQTKEGQVRIQKKQTTRREIRNDGLLMLRRRGMEADELAEQLDSLLPPLATLLQPQARFQDLVELDISRNRLSHLPTNLAMLKHLKILNASSNMLTAVPPVLYNLSQLEVLILSQNRLECIPADMSAQLPHLKTLRIAANRIRRIDANLGLWTKMQHLQLGSVFGGNLLTFIPDQIADMRCLEELDLSHNHLGSLPCNMHIATLVHLNVSDNQLSTIPKSIAQCARLRTLNVSKNHLATLPADLVQLTQLELFDLSENLLCIMPADILERMRTTLLITGNPLTHPGHCDLADNDAYAQIVRQMTLRAVPMAPTLMGRDRCGPHGMGCEEPASKVSVPTPAAAVAAAVQINQSAPPSASSSSSSSTSSSSSSSNSSNSNDIISNNNNLSRNISPPPYLRPQRRRSSSRHPHNHHDHPLHHHHRHHFHHHQFPEGYDDDAGIDRELSYHARQLNIRGSRPGTPKALVGTITPPRNSDDEDGNELDYVEQEEEDEPNTHAPNDGHNLIHSLREIATRAILKHSLKVPLEYLPPHLAEDLESRYRFCVACQEPFVHEWVTSVQVKSYKGHPAVVRRVRFCSTACWRSCLGKNNKDIPSIVSQSVNSASPSSNSATNQSIDWIEAAVAAAASEQHQRR